MAQPASSVIEHFTLGVDRLVAGGASFRLDKLVVANNSGGPVLVLLNSADDTVTKVAVVVDIAATDSSQLEGMMDTGCLIKAVSADVHVTLCRSQAGA